ncbi:MAG: TolC family outer membrane protein [Henriciella sp.]|nr:TolC family outer membrane protein [Henriciella sp.]
MVKQHIAISSFVIALALSGQAYGGTLQDAVQAAYLNNPQLDAQRQQAAIAEEQLEQARSQRRPTVSLAGSVGYESVDSNRPFSAASGSIGDRATSNAQLEAVLPIYTGGRVTAGIRQAKAGIGAADAQLESIGQDLVLDVVTAYVDVLRDRETIKIRQNSVELLTQQVRASQDRFDVGEVTRTDVAQSEARLEGSKASLAGAEATLQGSLAVYTFLVGAEAGDLVPVPPVPALPETIEIAMQMALDQNPAIVALRFNERAASEAVTVAVGALKPTVSLVGTASVQDTYDNNFQDTSVSALARATVPLYQGGLTRSQVRSAKLQRQQARYQIDNAERQVRAQVAQAWYSTIAANRAIEASARQVEAAEIAYEGAQAELSVGVRTTLDVLDQEQQLLEARLNLIEAERNAYVAAHQLLRAMGDLSA